MRPAVVLLAAALLLMPNDFAWGVADACPLPEVLAARAAIRESAATFTQERRIHYVREPVMSRGRLRYVAPDHLEMFVEEPLQESFTYDDGVLTIDAGDAEGERQVSVESDIMLSTMFSGLVGTLSGDEAELRRRFFINFQDRECEWQLELIPKSKRVLGKVEKINVSGNKQRIEKVEIFQASGDISILTIQVQE